jgi:hypothetical protein
VDHVVPVATAATVKKLATITVPAHIVPTDYQSTPSLSSSTSSSTTAMDVHNDEQMMNDWRIEQRDREHTEMQLSNMGDMSWALATRSSSSAASGSLTTFDIEMMASQLAEDHQRRLFGGSNPSLSLHDMKAAQDLITPVYTSATDCECSFPDSFCIATNMFFYPALAQCRVTRFSSKKITGILCPIPADIGVPCIVPQVSDGESPWYLCLI